MSGPGETLQFELSFDGLFYEYIFTLRNGEESPYAFKVQSTIRKFLCNPSAGVVKPGKSQNIMMKMKKSEVGEIEHPQVQFIKSYTLPGEGVDARSKEFWKGLD